MIAKVLAWGEDRNAALAKLHAALSELQVCLCRPTNMRLKCIYSSLSYSVCPLLLVNQYPSPKLIVLPGVQVSH